MGRTLSFRDRTPSGKERLASEAVVPYETHECGDAELIQASFAAMARRLFQTWRGVGDEAKRLAVGMVGEAPGAWLQPQRRNVNFNGSHRCLLVGDIG